MSREEIIEIMINTVNQYNTHLMKEAKATQEQIDEAVKSQRPAFEGMFGLIYDDLVANGVFQ
jgi:hypothetical protein